MYHSLTICSEDYLNMLLQRVREGGIYGLSFMLTAVVIGNAFQQKKQFYPAVVYLTKSNPSLAVSILFSMIFCAALHAAAAFYFWLVCLRSNYSLVGLWKQEEADTIRSWNSKSKAGQTTLLDRMHSPCGSS